MENNAKFRFGFMIVLLVIVLIGQFLAASYTQRETDERLQQFHEALNQNTLLVTALLNKLQTKNIVNKAEVIDEAQKLTHDLQALIEKMQNEQRAGMSESPSPEILLEEKETQ